MQLGVLAVNLTRPGLHGPVTRAGPRACVSVPTSRAAARRDRLCRARRDGTWWFWWSWADRIAPVGEVETAAFKIAYVLTPHADD